MIRDAIYNGLLQSDLDMAGFSLLNWTDPVGGDGGGGGLPEGWVSVKDHGGIADAKLVTDAAMTGGSATLTSATAAFTSADVGKSVSVNGVGASGGILQTTISGFTNSTTVTLTAAAGTTASAQYCAFGTDNTAPVQAAIAAAASTVFFPVGHYFFAGRIGNLPGNISLVGASYFGQNCQEQELKPLEGGTVLFLTANPGDSSIANAFIASNPVLDTAHVTSNQAIIGLKFYWPNQIPTAATPVAYPWAIYIINSAGSTIKYCAFLNAYQCVFLDSCGPMLIEEVRGQALYRGISLDRQVDVTRLRGIHFSQSWHLDTGVAVYQRNNAIAFDLARCDLLIVESCFAFRYKNWIHCYDNGNGGVWGQIIGGGGDQCATCIQIDQCQAQGIEIIGVSCATSSSGGYSPAPNLDLTVAATCTGAVCVHDSVFHSDVGTYALLQGTGEVTIDGCLFIADTTLGISGPTLVTTGVDASIAGGNVAVRNCTFRTTQPHVILGGTLIRAVVTGNMATGAVQITNNMTAGWAVIDNNSDGGTRYIGADARLVSVSGGAKLETRNTGTGVWVESARWTNP